MGLETKVNGVLTAEEKAHYESEGRRMKTDAVHEVLMDEANRADIRHLFSEGRLRREELQTLPSKLLIPSSWEIEAGKIRNRAEKLARDGIC